MLKLGVIFGGMSTEHDVSILSGMSVLKNLDKEKYEIYPIYISKEGEWFEYKGRNYDTKIGEEITNINKIENIVEYLKKLECMFPVLHGLYGEDGTVQGLFELLNIPYVGCKVVSSGIGMNKVYTKIVFDKAKLNQAEYVHIKKIEDKLFYIDEQLNQKQCTQDEIADSIMKKINFPIFIKPANSGSSVGVNKASNKEELIQNIIYAAKYDKDILVEQGIIGKEVECAILENRKNKDLKASTVGEVVPAEDFYSFDAKYKNIKSMTKIPANISREKESEIQEMAKKAFRAIDGTGLARVDFFIEESTNNIYINEINTMPGFTSISMYSKLLEADGIPYSKILDILIDLSVNY